MKHIVGLVVIASLLAAVPALGQQQKGDTELQLQGTLSLALNDDFEDSGSASVVWGRFWTDHSEAGVSATVAVQSEGDFGGYGGPFYRYNFLLDNKKVVPYVGAAAATTFGEFTGGDILLTFEGGARWFLDRNIAFSVAGSTWYDVDASEFSEQVNILFGFSYFWNS